MTAASLPAVARARAWSRAGLATAWTVAMYQAARARCWGRTGPDRAAIFDRWLRVWARGALAIAGVEIVGRGPRRARRGRLVIANHRTAYDIPLLQSLFGGSFVSRHDVADWPIVGAVARELKTIFVDRDDNVSGMSAIGAIRRQLQAGRTVTVFPEGGTFPGDEVRPLHAGAFAAARGLAVDIVPVGLAWPRGCEYVQDDFADHFFEIAGRARVPVGLRVGAPLPAQATAKQQAARARFELQRLVDAARADVRSRRAAGPRPARR